MLFKILWINNFSTDCSINILYSTFDAGGFENIIYKWISKMKSNKKYNCN